MRVAFFAHYNATSSVAGYIWHHVAALRDLGFETVFISNSPIGDKDRDRLEGLCERIILRENAGYDFAMWQAAFADRDLSQVDQLLLTNSSIVGPLQPLKLLWTRVDEEADFWGLTENSDPRAHLQSYFLVFSGNVVRSAAFAQFWKSVISYRDKLQLIRSYEVGLTAWLEEHGFRWRALFPRDEVLQSAAGETGAARQFVRYLRGHSVPGPNITLTCPHYLLNAGMPYIKRAVLEPGNPYLSAEDARSLLARSDLPEAALAEIIS